MATLLLSRHSSNPLEVASSDIRNRKYVRKYNTAKQSLLGIISASSDDPFNSINAPELEQYREHLAQLYPGASIPAPASNRKPVTIQYVDLDEDMQSEEDGPGAGSVVDEEDAESEEEDQDMDAPGDTDEEMTINLKPREERQEIQEEIADLGLAVPRLKADYKVVDRLGTGTFSSVYKAIDLHHHSKWDNSVWQSTHPQSSSAYYQSGSRGTKVFVAIKRIYVTSGPERIRNEISIMEDCRSCRHVSQLITAFRHYDQVVAIMPYHRNEDFRDFFRVLPLDGIKAYFRCLFRALRDIHSRNIIHRDVKPANFLFDPRSGTGTLCDFGLACRMDRGPSLGACLHTHATRQHPHGKLKPPEEYDVEYIKKMQREGRHKSSLPSDRVGYPEKDTRPHSKANRAGTRGFRAPEVLLKCGEQTGAIDMWSAGMILLFFLTEKFPLLQSSDDVEALMEIAAIVGRRRMEKAATLHSRVFQTNVPSISQEGVTWRKFVERLNPNVRIPPKPNPRYYPYSCGWTHTRPPPSSSSPPSITSSSRSPSPDSQPRTPSLESYASNIDSALDLVEQLMHPESVRRITPRKALYHPFLRDPEEPEDDELFPHPLGEGVCATLHFRDDVTEEHCVRMRARDGSGEMEVKRVAPGQGIAVGRRPCEFHFEDDECL